MLGLRFSTLRVYRWQVPSISIGYFTPGQMVQEKVFAEWDKVRRWTGGGIVFHDHQEITYSIVIPASDVAFRLCSAELYREIHLALGKAFPGIESTLAEGVSTSDGTCACFEHPVPGDLITLDGRKIAGAAQRRCRRGVLHQGSLRLPFPFHNEELNLERFASHLASSAVEQAPLFPSDELTALDAKYNSHPWMNRI